MSYPISTIGSIGAPACCEPCARGRACASSTMGAPPSSAAHDLGVTSSGWLPTIVWPSDVDALKRRLEPDFAATDATVSRCANLPSGEAVAWGDFFGSWKKFRDEETPIFGAANKFDEGKTFEARLREWQTQLARTCKLNSPAVTPDAGPDTSAVKWIAAAVIVVGLAYVASPLIMGARKIAK